MITNTKTRGRKWFKQPKKQGNENMILVWNKIVKIVQTKF